MSEDCFLNSKDGINCGLVRLSDFNDEVKKSSDRLPPV